MRVSPVVFMVAMALISILIIACEDESVRQAKTMFPEGLNAEIATVTARQSTSQTPGTIQPVLRPPTTTRETVSDPTILSHIEKYNKEIDLDPGRADSYYNRGLSYVKLGQYEHAIDDFDKAVELNPSDAQAYGDRGNSYGELGQSERAIKEFDKAIQLDPD